METTLSATTDAVATKVYAGNSANILNTAMTLGKDAATSYLKSKTNLALVGFTAIACTAGEFIPAAGQAACLTGLRAVAAGFTKEVAKTWVKGLIDRNTSLTTTQKANYKLLVDASTTAFDVFSMNPTGGMIDQIENFGAVSDVTDLVLSAVDNNTFCIVYKKRNSSAVYQIGVCKR